MTVELFRCHQCWKKKPLSAFEGRVNCAPCREQMRNRRRLDNYRKGLRTEGEAPRVTWVPRSGNKKIGPIPTSMTSSETCPPSCKLFNAGCYGENSFMRHHWRRAEKGFSWQDFCSEVANLPEGTLWRHNTVGDLPGVLDLPVAVTLPSNETRKHFKTPEGNQVVRCPATYSELTCKTCELCAFPNRKAIIGFPAHGTLSKLVDLRLKGSS